MRLRAAVQQEFAKQKWDSFVDEALSMSQRGRGVVVPVTMCKVADSGSVHRSSRRRSSAKGLRHRSRNQYSRTEHSLLLSPQPAHPTPPDPSRILRGSSPVSATWNASTFDFITAANGEATTTTIVGCPSAGSFAYLSAAGCGESPSWGGPTPSNLFPSSASMPP
jgi:hypothetical protein